MDIHKVYRPVSIYFRTQRLKLFYELFSLNESTKLLDVGGNLFFWELAKNLGFPCPQVTIVNIFSPEESLPENITWIVGNAKKLPFENMAFDVAFSNSVIEHLYDWESQKEFAHEIKRIAPKYFVQTPSRRFPVETHFLTPFIHYAPKSIQKKLIRNFTLWGLITRASQKSCDKMVEEIRLLNSEEMSKLFPDATLEREKIVGLEKSIMAIKNSSNIT
jgi:hypothetical protein